MIAEAAALIDDAERVVVLTGAGISTDSEIPDFRGPQGVWTKNPAAEKMATIQHYVEDPEVRRRAWQSRLTSPVWQAIPNRGHLAMLTLEERGKLDVLITQNIDGLHHVAGTDPARIVEIHGSIREVVCLGCDHRAPMDTALERVRSGDTDPACPDCGGILKSSTISFGQSLVVEDLQRAEAAARSADLLLAVGSTLAVSRSPTWYRWRRRTGPKWSSSTDRRPRWTIWLTWSFGVRSARRFRLSSAELGVGPEYSDRGHC